MIKVKNIATGEIIIINNANMQNNKILAHWKSPSPKADGKFFQSHTYFVYTDEFEIYAPKGIACRVISLADGYELVEGRTRSKSAKVAAPKPAPEPTHEPEPQPIAPEPIVEPAPVNATPSNVDETALAIAQALKGLQVKAEAIITREEVANMIAEEVERVSHRMRCIEFKVVTSTATNTITGSVCEHFQEYCNLVNVGKPLYMYGPAGCGKSYTAKQIAEALGLDYYETSQAMFAHELKGYGDAKGEFVPTAFYRAFTGGGVFFLDEVDASAPEAVVVLNNAIANKRFDFPVIGNVDAHPNFRVIAAGNTRMTGATLAYTARQMQDTSFKNRFFFELMTYDKNVEVEIAGGDMEVVSFAHDLRKAARETGIFQLVSYRQISDLATLQQCCDDEMLVRGSVLQEKEVDEANILYDHLEDKYNRWARAMKKCIETMKTEEVW